jgi:hypothetical protein
MSLSNLRYPPERYDEYLALRVPFLLWVTMVFLIRHLLLLGITFLPTTGEEITVLRELIRPLYLAADLLALPVLVVAARRRPQAARWMRRLWPAGRALLMLSAALYLALLGAQIAAAEARLSDAIDEATILSAFLNAAVIAYLWRSPLVRDLFRQWPEAGEPPPRSRRTPRAGSGASIRGPSP